MHCPRLHSNFFLQPVVVVTKFLVKAELDHWIIEPQADPRVESVDNDLRVVRPCLILMGSMLCKESEGLNTTILAIVAGQYQQPVVADIGKPYFVLDQKPVGMMGNIKVPPAFRW